MARCEQKWLQKNDNIFEYVEHKQSGKGGIKVITAQHSSELKDLRADAYEGIWYGGEFLVWLDEWWAGVAIPW